MEYLADTVTIVRHMRSHPALGRQAARILSQADSGQHRIYLSPITLMEVLYLAAFSEIEVGLLDLVNHVNHSRNYRIVSLGADIVLTAIEIDDVPESHDRILVATAKHLAVPILTGDQVIARSKHVVTVW